MNRPDYRCLAEKDALEFAQFLCKQNINLADAQFLVFIESNGTIKKNSPRGIWREGVEFPKDLLQHLIKAGLTGTVFLAAWPENNNDRFGIEIQVDDNGFYPLLPNVIQSSYRPNGYVGADGKIVRIPRDPHPGRYYFPDLIAVS